MRSIVSRVTKTRLSSGVLSRLSASNILCAESGSRTAVTMSPQMSPSALAAVASSMLPSGPAPGSFLATGKSQIIDTLYFRKLGAEPAGEGTEGAFKPDTFSGRVVLLVNTASLCGFTPQLRALQVCTLLLQNSSSVVLECSVNETVRS